MSEETNESINETPPVAFQTQSEEINEVAGALSLAQGDMAPAKKTGSNTFFKSTYADLNSVIEATRFPLSANDLSMIQYCDDGYVVTQLMHSSGQWLRGRMRITPKDNSPQAIGSALSYARRYSWQMMVGLASADDDGEAAMGRGADEGYGSAYDPAHAKPVPRKKTTTKKTTTTKKKTSARVKKEEPSGEEPSGEEPKVETTVAKEPSGEEPKTVTSTEDAPTSSIPDQTKEAGKIVNATSEGAAYLRFHDVDPDSIPLPVQTRIIEKGIEGFGEMVAGWIMKRDEDFGEVEAPAKEESA